MDIVVTIPKRCYETNNIERSLQKEDKNTYGFRVFKFKPKKLKKGDRIYFCKNNIIEYSKEVIDIEEQYVVETCIPSGIQYVGNYIIRFKNERCEKNLKISCKGFQGFRYKWWD